MKTAAWVTLFYGLIVIAGGIIGFLKANSTTSIVVGSISGFLLLLTALGMMGRMVAPAYLALAITLILDAFFTYRWIATYNFMPSGLMTVISTLVLLVLALLIRSRR
ncbi:MAG: TMEM14 family protein [Verrucomicrobia bacterium]|nr:TMEM14 family protein [Verrucomicrobiota bacterium]